MGGKSANWEEWLQRIAPALPSWWETTAMVLGAALLVWWTLRIRAWFRDDAGDSESPVDLLAQMRELQREGGLSEEEYRLIKTRLVQTAADGPFPPRAEAPAGNSAPAKSAAAGPAPSIAESPQGSGDSPGTEGSGVKFRHQ